MSEFINNEPNIEQLRVEGLKEVCERYLDPEDIEFLEEMEDEDERVGYVYGRLLDIGEDPDDLFEQYGVTERDDDEI